MECIKQRMYQYYKMSKFGQIDLSKMYLECVKIQYLKLLNIINKNKVSRGTPKEMGQN